MTFKKGDRVIHKNRGKGTFIEYDWEGDFTSVVEFDEEGCDALRVSTDLLTKES